MSVHDDARWRALAEAVEEGFTDARLACDARFATVSGRMRHHDEIDERIEAWTGGLPSAEVEARLKQAGVSAARMRRVQDLVEDGEPSRAYKKMTEPRVGSMLATVLPVEFSGKHSAGIQPGPWTGTAHTRGPARMAGAFRQRDGGNRWRRLPWYSSKDAILLTRKSS